MLLNSDRAAAVMDKYGLDGLIASMPANVYYLTDFTTPLMTMGKLFSTFAVLPRDQAQPAALVLPAVVFYSLDKQPTWVPNVRGYGAFLRPTPGQPRDYDSFTEDLFDERNDSASLLGWPVRKGPPTARDAQLVDLVKRQSISDGTALQALVQSLIDAGLEKGRIGVDDPRMIGWLQAAGLPELTGVDAFNIFREIRMVKTPEEIVLLRKAGQINEAGLDAVIEALEPGIPLGDLEQIHALKVTELGGRPTFLSVSIRGIATGFVERDELIKFDGVSTYRQYHGDIGRTAICGTPTDEMLLRARAVQRALEIAYDMIRPGVAAQDVSRMCLEVLAKEGFPGFVIANPHTVGLEHTDHPLSMGLEMPGHHGDLIFEENMVFTLDMPYHEYGWGSTHVEDMVVVRPHGCEGLTSLNTELRVRPG
jgi:Xaa-Pro aminopeptidase